MKQFNTLLLKWGLCVGMVLGSVTAFAEAGSGTGKDIEMYTFFPVPKVSYNNIYVTDRFDVGTQKSPFTLTLGHPKINNDDITPSLQLDSSSIARLKGGTESSKNNLEWNVDIYTNEATFGNYSDAASSTASQLTFNNLFAKELTKSTDHPADEINAKKVKVNGKMKMISNAFTSEEASALPGCAATVSWNTFKIGGNNRTFLECSEAPSSGGSDDCPSGKYKWQRSSSHHANCNMETEQAACDYIISHGINYLQMLKDSDCEVGGEVDFYSVQDSASTDGCDEKPTDSKQYCVTYWAKEGYGGVRRSSIGTCDAIITAGHACNTGEGFISGKGEWTCEDRVVIWESVCISE